MRERRWYKLLPDHTVEPIGGDLVDQISEWARWCTAEREAGRSQHVADEYPEPGLRVSTVFLGQDESGFGVGPPLLFETMVFDERGRVRGGAIRYATWDDAEAGHKRIVAALRAGSAMPQ